MKDVHGWMLTGNKERMLWLDWARAVAMLFILLGHAQVSIPYVNRFALLFYVPVFFVTSGCVYHARQDEETFSAFLRRRAARLLKPYFGYSLFLLVCYGVKEWISGGQWMHSIITPLVGILYGRNSVHASGQAGMEVLMTIWNAPLWFLPALFLSEVLFEVIYRAVRGEKRRLAAALTCCFGVGIILHYLVPILLPWSLECIPLFAVWLGAGYFLRPCMHKIKCGMAIAATIAVLCAWKNGPVNISLGLWGISVTAGMAGTLCASVLLLGSCFVLEEWLRKRQGDKAGRCLSVLTVIGQNTLPILGMHLFVFMWIEGAAELLLPKGVPDILWRVGMVPVTIAVILAGIRCLAVCKVVLKKTGNERSS